MPTSVDRSIFYICHADHDHDRVFAENVTEYLDSQGIQSKSIVFGENGQRPQLRESLQDNVIGVLGFNAQLDHSWIESTNFLDAAAEKQVPVIQWILDHPSSRLFEFNNSTASNSRFLFSSANAELYFRRYGIAGALTAHVACVGPNRHSRIDEFSLEAFSQRPINCMVAMNLRRIGGTIEDVRARMATLEPRLSQVVEMAIDGALLDLIQPLETHFERALEAFGGPGLLNCSVVATAPSSPALPSPNAVRHACMQMLEEIVQITRRQKIFEIAREFPLLIQSDDASRRFQHGATAKFEENVDMPLTWSRLQRARAQVSVSNMHDMVHDRILNGLNAGCVNIMEDSFANRRVFEDGRNALFFRYDDDSLRECLSQVCNDLEGSFEIAEAGFAMRDKQPFRFGNFQNIIKLAQRRGEEVERLQAQSRSLG
jgi:hypothetical protein